jgi:hypothetical protein
MKSWALVGAMLAANLEQIAHALLARSKLSTKFVDKPVDNSAA